MSDKEIPPNEDVELIFLWPYKNKMHAIVSIDNTYYLVERPIDNKTNLLDLFKIK